MSLRPYKSLLPPNATKLELALEKAIYRSTNLDYHIDDLWNPNTVDETFITYLAWSLGVEIWSKDLNIEQKRQLLKDYVSIRKIRGTMAALKKALKAINVDAVITERPDNKAFSFKIEISRQNITSELKKDIIMLVDLLKPLRTRYNLNVTFNFTSSVGILGTIRATQIYHATGVVSSI